MPLISLDITYFRNITSAKIECSPKFNLFFGNNAAGKTSVLEAMYYLGTGKSFRTHHHTHAINTHNECLTLFSQLELGNSILPIGIRRFRTGAAQIHIANEPVTSVAEISRYLPIQFIGSDSQRILNDGPKFRRQFLDWGLFHTNPLFFAHWKTFQKLSVQRNSALKAKAPKDELLIWNHAFASSGEELNLMRQNYFDRFLLLLNKIISFLLPNVAISIEYLHGWNQNLTLEACLNQNVSRETFVGHGLYGPQRADLSVTVDNLPAQEILSQGQQKLVSYALKLAQGLDLHALTGKSPIYLIDDLPSELDSEKRALVISILSDLNAQVFITGINPHDFDEQLTLDGQNRMFHVEHGSILTHGT